MDFVEKNNLKNRIKISPTETDIICRNNTEDSEEKECFFKKLQK